MRFLVWMLGFPLAYALNPHNILIQKLQNIQSMEASFEQSVFLNGRKKASSFGQLSLERPKWMRWEIKKPTPQLLIADGKTFWVYEPNLQQATKRPQRQGVGGAAGLFLSASPNLWVQRYKVNLQQKGSRMLFELHAKKSKGQFQDVRLSFEGADLISIEFRDQLGQDSVINLNNVHTNAAISKNQFMFSPPKHTDVIVVEK